MAATGEGTLRFRRATTLAFRDRFVLRPSWEALPCLDGSGITRNVTYQPARLCVHDQASCKRCGSSIAGELLEGTREGRFVWNLPCARPTANAAQLPVCVQPLQLVEAIR
jgi:hypothetical protein